MALLLIRYCTFFNSDYIRKTRGLKIKVKCLKIVSPDQYDLCRVHCIESLRAEAQILNVNFIILNLLTST